MVIHRGAPTGTDPGDFYPEEEDVVIHRGAPTGTDPDDFLGNSKNLAAALSCGCSPAESTSFPNFSQFFPITRVWVPSLLDTVRSDFFLGKAHKKRDPKISLISG